MNAETVQAIPAAGWALLFLVVAVAGGILLKKEVRLKNVEVVSKRELDREKRIHNQYDVVALLTSQYANAINLLQGLRIGLRDAGREHLELKTQAELSALEDVTARIGHRIEREVLLDLIRNHFGDKSKEELKAYADAKAEGYWRRVNAELSDFAARFPGQNLPALMDYIPVESYRKLFEEIYSSANRIAGEHLHQGSRKS